MLIKSLLFHIKFQQTVTEILKGSARFNYKDGPPHKRAIDGDSKLEVVDLVDGYRRSKQPVVTAEKVEKVEGKIELDRIALAKFREREIGSDYYFKYHENPFLNISEAKKRESARDYERQGVKPVNIVNLISPKYDRNGQQQRLQERCSAQKFSKLKVEFQLQSQKLIRSLLTKSHPKSQISSQLKQALPQKQEKPENIEDNLESLEIQQIAQFREENFFMKNRKRINIFKLTKEGEHCIGAVDHLRKHKFEFSGMIERNYKLRIPIYRDLSRLGRLALMGRSHSQSILDYVFADELNINPKCVQFADLISVCSNRLTSDLVSSIINSSDNVPEDPLDSESRQDQIFIPYHKKTRNRQANLLNDNDEAQEREVFKQVELTEQESTYQERVMSSKNRVLEQQNFQNSLLSQTVRDSNEHFNLTQNIKQMIHKIIEEGSAENEGTNINNRTGRSVGKSKEQDLQKTIRINKIHSERGRLILLKQFSQMLKAKNHLVLSQTMPTKLKK